MRLRDGPVRNSTTPTVEPTRKKTRFLFATFVDIWQGGSNNGLTARSGRDPDWRQSLPPSLTPPREGSMRRTAYIVSAWTLLLAACGPAAAPGPTTAPAGPATTAPAAKPTTAPATAPTTAPA